METSTNFEQLLDETIEKYSMLEVLEQSDNPLGLTYDDDKLFDEYLNLLKALDIQPSILTLPEERIDDYINLTNQIRIKLSQNPIKVHDIAEEYYGVISHSYDTIKEYIHQENNKLDNAPARFEYLTTKCSAILEHNSLVCTLLETNLINLEYFDGISFDSKTSTLHLNIDELEFDCGGLNLDLHVYATAFNLWINELRKHFWVEGKVSIQNIDAL